MRQSRPKKLPDLISANKANALHLLYRREHSLTKLNAIFKDLVHSELQKHCKIINYRQGVLVIASSSASWLTRLRYEQSNILSNLRRRGMPALSSIKLTVDPNLMLESNIKPKTDTTSTRSIAPLSAKSAELLLELSQKSPTKLKKSLEKLALTALK